MAGESVMAFVHHRSNRVERLAEHLAEHLPAFRGNDPFAPFPVVVGSRAMARWLSHELATHRGVAAGIVYPLPRRGIFAAIESLLSGLERIDPDLDAPDPFAPDALALRILPLLHHERDGAFARLADSITTRTENGRVVADFRSLAFARELADVLDRLIHEAPDVALRWARGQRVPEDHAPLAHLLARLGVAEADDSPAARLSALEALAPSRVPEGFSPLVLFGLSTLGPGDRRRLRALAAKIDVHLFSVVPTLAFFEPGRRARVEPENVENPVLAALGRGSATLVDLDVEASPQDGLHEVGPGPDAGASPSLLVRLQRWIAGADPLDADRIPWPVGDDDASFAVHAAPGALRQCEVVRDLLLEAFAADRTLMPKDVVIQTPDPATYAPLMSLVLAREGIEVADDGTRRRLFEPIPAVAADIGLREQNVVAEILLRLLHLASGRIVASAVAELLALEPVQAALGLSAEAAAAAGALLADAGFTWGGCAEDRERLLERFDDRNLAVPEGGADDQFTARFGAARLALGVAQHDPHPLWVQAPAADGGHRFVEVAPRVAEGSTQAEAASVLVLALRRLDRLHHEFTTPRTVEDWVATLARALDAWCVLPADRAFLRREVDDVLDGWRRAAEGACVLLDVDAVVGHLEQRLDRPARGDRPVTGAVTISGLEPLRAVPFRIVVLLGMDDGAFPRGDTRPAYDPLAPGAPLRKEVRLLDRADVDRHILLEALLSARDRLVVTFTGRDPHTNEPRPAAVPIEELLATVGALTGRGRDDLVVEHPLQPYSPRAFEPGNPVQSPDPGFLSVARTRAAIEAGDEAARPGGTALLGSYDRLVLPPPSVRPTYRIRDLAAWLYRPTKCLVERRLDLRDFDETAVPDDLDPTDAPDLSAEHLERLFEALLDAGEDERDALEPLWRRLAAEGRVPLGAGTRGSVRLASKYLLPVTERTRRLRRIERATIPVRVDMGDLGLLEDSWDGYVWIDEKGTRRALLPILAQESISPWTKMVVSSWALAFCASPAANVDGISVVMKKNVNPKTFGSPAPDDAKRALRDLARVVHEAHCRPIRLFPRMGEKIAHVLLFATEPKAVYLGRTPVELERALAAGTAEGMRAPANVERIAWAAAAEYFGGGTYEGDRTAPAIAEVFAGYDPVGAIRREGLGCEEVRLACRVWGRILALEKGRPTGDAAASADEGGRP